MPPRKVELTEQSHSPKMTKIERYGWIVKDTPGVMMLIDKQELRVNHEYQRQIVASKVTDMSACWSWVACGTITVGMRDGAAWVLDGQHRVAAAKRRADITNLPCIVFDLDSVEDEAKGFLSSNRLRGQMTSVDHFRAELVAGNAVAKLFNDVCNDLDLVVTSSNPGPGAIKSAAWGMRRFGEDAAIARTTLELASEIAKDGNMPVPEILLEGLWYIHHNSDASIEDAKVRQRIKKIGARLLLRSAQESAAFFSRGGAKVWAHGMLQAINKGLQRKYKFTNAPTED
jgi:hypothetical protein